MTASPEKKKHLDRDCVYTAAQYLPPTVFRHLVRQPCVDIDSRSTPSKLVRFTGILAFLCFGNFFSFSVSISMKLDYFILKNRFNINSHVIYFSLALWVDCFLDLCQMCIADMKSKHFGTSCHTWPTIKCTRTGSRKKTSD